MPIHQQKNRRAAAPLPAMRIGPHPVTVAQHAICLVSPLPRLGGGLRAARAAARRAAARGRAVARGARRRAVARAARATRAARFRAPVVVDRAPRRAARGRRREGRLLAAVVPRPGHARRRARHRCAAGRRRPPPAPRPLPASALPVSRARTLPSSHALAPSFRSRPLARRLSSSRARSRTRGVALRRASRRALVA